MNDMSAGSNPDSATIDAEALAAAAAIVQVLDVQAERFETPCGDGHMVWRRWGEGPPVVLVHGGAGAWSHWIRNIEPLMDRHTVWALDMPGLGESASPHEFTVEAIGAPIAEGIRRLLPEDESFDLVGFSFGGPVSAFAASQLPGRVRHYVLAASRFVLEDRNVFPRLMAWKSFEDPVERLAAHRRNLELMMITNVDRVDALALQIQSTNAPRARFYGPKLQPGEKLHKFLPQVRAQSITAISGKKDHVAMLIMDQQEAALKSFHARARFHAIDDVGHWVQYEAAERFNELLDEALHGEQ